MLRNNYSGIFLPAVRLLTRNKSSLNVLKGKKTTWGTEHLVPLLFIFLIGYSEAFRQFPDNDTCLHDALLVVSPLVLPCDDSEVSCFMYEILILNVIQLFSQRRVSRS